VPPATIEEFPMTSSQQLDLVLQGATGFTGHLVAEHLFRRHPPTGPADGGLRWGLGGRNRAKLEAVRAGLGALGAGAEEIPLVIADSRDPEALRALVEGTRVVVSTVGPYARYGSDLVAACARSGTHYCDITGEVQWVRRMIDAHEDEARRSGARLVHFCGFDSIPSDLGVWFLQDAAMKRWGSPLDRITLGVRKMRGAASGGTIASMLEALEEARNDRDIRRLLANPYALDPRDSRRGPDETDQRAPRFDRHLDRWTAPFVMAQVNTRVVRRSNAVLGHPWGEDFRYHETLITGTGLRGRIRAYNSIAGLGAFVGAASFAPTRALLQKVALPSPGEGPSARKREAGFFDMVLVGRHQKGTLHAVVTGDRDPGYGATSRMLGEAAACLAQDGDSLEVGGGSWTPASAFGGVLIERLREHAGMTFELE
jgi:short subunit dehydrogenase-like uncharacterized protein